MGKNLFNNRSQGRLGSQRKFYLTKQGKKKDSATAAVEKLKGPRPFFTYPAHALPPKKNKNTICISHKEDQWNGNPEQTYSIKTKVRKGASA